MTKQETKSEKFKRLATLRVSKLLKGIDILGNLSSPAYEYTDEEVTKIFSALADKINKVEIYCT